MELNDSDKTLSIADEMIKELQFQVRCYELDYKSALKKNLELLEENKLLKLKIYKLEEGK